MLVNLVPNGFVAFAWGEDVVTGDTIFGYVVFRHYGITVGTRFFGVVRASEEEGV